MDFSDLKARCLAARTFTVAVAGIELQLLEPTRRDYQTAALAHAQLDNENVRLGAMQRTLVCNAVQGWQGLTVGHVLQEESDTTPVEFSADAVALLFDERPDVEMACTTGMLTRVSERAARIKAAAKN